MDGAGGRFIGGCSVVHFLSEPFGRVDSGPISIRKTGIIFELLHILLLHIRDAVAHLQRR